MVGVQERVKNVTHSDHIRHTRPEAKDDNVQFDNDPHRFSEKGYRQIFVGEKLRLISGANQ
jgi:hypothetical protein